jgi:hypothetical protein
VPGTYAIDARVGVAPAGVRSRGVADRDVVSSAVDVSVARPRTIFPVLDAGSGAQPAHVWWRQFAGRPGAGRLNDPLRDGSEPAAGAEYPAGRSCRRHSADTIRAIRGSTPD